MSKKLPITIIKASSPLTYLTLSIHFPRLLNELASGVKKKNTGEVENDNGGAAVLNVRGYEGMKSLLSSSVPELHSKGFIIDINGFRDKINSNSGLIYERKILVNYQWNYQR